MPKWKTSLFIALLAAVALAQEPATAPGGHEDQPGGMSASGIMPPSVRRVGQRLACLCRTCKNTVADCPMLECGYSSPTRRKIAEMQAAGKTDDEIVNAIVAENGKEALAVPHSGIFHCGVDDAVRGRPDRVVGDLGLPPPHVGAPRATPAVDPAVLDRYHDQIEKDLKKLE